MKNEHKSMKKNNNNIHSEPEKNVAVYF